MVATTAIRRIEIHGTATGVDESRQKLGALDQSMQKLQRTMEQNNRLNDQAVQAQRQLTAANDNYSRSTDVLTSALRAGAKVAAEQAASYAAGAAKAALLAAALTAVAAVLGPLYVAYRILKQVVDLATDAINLSGEALERYRKIARDAAAIDLSTGFFQRITKAAADAKLPVDDLTAAMQKLEQSSRDRLGGSALQNRIDQHLKAGNFAGNAGVADFASANTTEERFRAVVKLIDQAMEKGQRLAAIDIADSAFGPKVAENLRKDSEYLSNMLAAADKIAAKDLVSTADVGRALDMQNRYDAAAKILSERWHPLQETLTKLGIEMRDAWIGVVEQIAAAVDWAAKLVSKLDGVPTAFRARLQSGLDTLGSAFMNATTTPEGRKEAEKSFGISSDPAEMAKGTDAYADAVKRLREGLQNQFGVQQKVNEANAVANKARGDTSRTLNDQARQAGQTSDAVDTMLNSLRRHAAVQEADAMAVGLGAGALARFRAEAQFTAAVQANGGKVTAEQAAEFERLKQRAEEAAVALAKARVKDEIRFGRETALLSQEDVAIAQQLRGIYPDVATALSSVEASALRTNQALSSVSSTVSSNLTSGLADIFDGTKTVSQGFADMSKSIVRALQEAMIKALIVGPILRSLGLGSGGGGLANLFGGASGPTSLGGPSGPTPLYANGGFTGPGGIHQPAGIVHAGEFVFSQASVNRLGLGYLNALHQAGTRGYAVGGPVMPAADPRAANSNDQRPINFTIVNETGRPVTATQGKTAEGDPAIFIRDMVRGVVAEDAANNGPMSKALMGRAAGFNGR